MISCFEVALRNRINKIYTAQHGDNWIRDSAAREGIFDNYNCRHTRELICRSVYNLEGQCTHPKLIAQMDFGFWRYLFAQPQFYAGGQVLLRVFPDKPRSTPSMQYNQSYVFNQLGRINDLRNRIAHHEPICFANGYAEKDTTYARQHYSLILQLFRWMNIDESALLYGLDHINPICDQIDEL